MCNTCVFIGVRLPASNKTIYSYFVDFDSGNFIQWDTLVPSTQSLIEKGSSLTLGDNLGVGGENKEDKNTQESDIVTTVDTVRYSFLTSLLLLNKNPVLLTGKFSAKFSFLDNRFSKILNLKLILNYL